MLNKKSFVYHEAVAVENPEEELVLHPAVRGETTFRTACNRGALHAEVMNADETAAKFSDKSQLRKACIICFPRSFKSLASCEQICGRRTDAGLCVSRCDGGRGVAHLHACRTHSASDSAAASADPNIGEGSDGDSSSEEATPVIPNNCPWAPPTESARLQWFQ